MNYEYEHEHLELHTCFFFYESTSWWHERVYGIVRNCWIFDDNDDVLHKNGICAQTNSASIQRAIIHFHSSFRFIHLLCMNITNQFLLVLFMKGVIAIASEEYLWPAIVFIIFISLHCSTWDGGSGILFLQIFFFIFKSCHLLKPWIDVCIFHDKTLISQTQTSIWRWYQTS